MGPLFIPLEYNLLPLETLRSEDGVDGTTLLKKWICVLSIFIAIISSHWLTLQYLNSKEPYPSSEREEILTSLVYVLRKKWSEAFSSRSCAVTAKKGTKKSDARAY